LQELFTGAEATVNGGMLSLESLPDIGVQVWRARE